MTNTAAQTVVIPADVDDINGIGISEFIDEHNIDRDSDQRYRIEDALWAAYQEAAAAEVEGAGFEAVKSRYHLGTWELECQANDLDAVWRDELPGDMAKAWKSAVDQVEAAMAACEL